MTGGLKERILGIPLAYRLMIAVLGGNIREKYAREYLMAKPGDRVLDLGCGPADILPYLPAVSYVGVDLDPNYVAAARKRFGDRGEFRCGPAESVADAEPGTFDLVMANGLLHHLTDDQAAGVFRVARAALRPGGRLVTLDNGFVDGQSRVARWLIRRDRGKFVRTPDGYFALARASFRQVVMSIRHDLMRVPYTHVMLTCTKLPG